MIKLSWARFILFSYTLQEEKGAQVVIVPELVDFLVSSLRKVVSLSLAVASNTIIQKLT